MPYIVKNLSSDASRYIARRGLASKWRKVEHLLAHDLFHPSLHFKKVVLQGTVFYSFRLDKKYRGVCILQGNVVEVIVITDHYQ